MRFNRGRLACEADSNNTIDGIIAITNKSNTTTTTTTTTTTITTTVDLPAG
jgi:hypothetical protein